MKDAVFYQVYPQSFCDSNGDGIGDLRGLISRLDYIKSLGATAVWLNPIFESPFGDAGYDISDFRKVAPRYGTNADAVRLFRVDMASSLVKGETNAAALGRLWQGFRAWFDREHPEAVLVSEWSSPIEAIDAGFRSLYASRMTYPFIYERAIGTTRFAVVINPGEADVTVELTGLERARKVFGDGVTVSENPSPHAA